MTKELDELEKKVDALLHDVETKLRFTENSAALMTLGEVASTSRDTPVIEYASTALSHYEGESFKVVDEFIKEIVKEDVKRSDKWLPFYIGQLQRKEAIEYARKNGPEKLRSAIGLLQFCPDSVVFKTLSQYSGKSLDAILGKFNNHTLPSDQAYHVFQALDNHSIQNTIFCGYSSTPEHEEAKILLDFIFIYAGRKDLPEIAESVRDLFYNYDGKSYEALVRYINELTSEKVNSDVLSLGTFEALNDKLVAHVADNYGEEAFNSILQTARKRADLDLVKTVASCIKKDFWPATGKTVAGYTELIMDLIHRGIAEEEAGDYLDKIKSLDPSITWTLSWYEGIDCLSEHQNFSSGIDLFTKEIVANPQHTEAYFNRGLCKYFILKRRANLPLKDKVRYDYDGGKDWDGDYKDVIDDLSKAIELEPNNVEAYYQRGRARFEQDLTERRLFGDALQDFQKAIELNPQLADAHLYEGRAFFELAQDDDDRNNGDGTDYGFVYNHFCGMALSALTRAIEIQPNLGEAYYYRHFVWEGLGEKDKAQADGAKAKELGYKND